MVTGVSAGDRPVPPADSVIDPRLYIADQTTKSISAIANLKRICERHLCGRCRIEVIDLVRQPQRAQADGIIAIPTLVCRFPEPVRRVFGDCSNDQHVLTGLGLWFTTS